MQQSVKSQFELYLQRSDLRPASVRFKTRALSYFVQWFGDLPVDQVTTAIAEDYRTMLSKGRSKRSANGYLANFRPFWNWLTRHGKIRSSPFSSVDDYVITEQPRETFSPTDLSRLLRVSGSLWRARICLGLLGCRRGEMFNLTVRDVNFDPPHPHILLQPKIATAQTWPWDLKGHAIRYVALPEVMQFEDVIVKLHAEIISLIEQLPTGQPYIFLENRYYKNLMRLQAADKLTDQEIADPTGNYQRMFRAVQKRAGVTPLRRYHELRAAFATQMIEHLGLARAADALGHKSVETTRKYDRKSRMGLVADISRIAEESYQSNVP